MAFRPYKQQLFTPPNLDTGEGDATCPDAVANPMGAYRFLRALQDQPTPVSGTMNLPDDTL